MSKTTETHSPKIRVKAKAAAEGHSHLVEPDAENSPAVDENPPPDPKREADEGTPPNPDEGKQDPKPKLKLGKGKAKVAKLQTEAKEPACSKCGKLASQFAEGGVEGYLRNVRPAHPRGLWKCFPECVPAT
jgi:hypothetical protein